jgi:hypothetical protein
MNAERKSFRAVPGMGVWWVVFWNNAHCEITRMLSRLAVLTAALCVVGGLTLPAQGQPADDPASTNCPPVAVEKSSPLIPDESADSSAADLASQTALIAEDSNRASTMLVLKELPPANKPSGRPEFRTGYGQFFPEQHLFPPHTSAEIEAPSWLYLKLSFSF